MTDEQKAAFINSQTIAAQIALHSMLAENKDREANGYALAYREESFIGLIYDYGIDPDSVKRLFDSPTPQGETT